MTKRKSMALASGFLALCLMVGMAVAYYMAQDSAANVFTIGRIHIIQNETKFPTEDKDKGTGEKGKDGVPDECELVIPYAEIPKDPYIQNVDRNDCIVFMKVKNPAEMLTLIGEEGGRGKEALCDLFWLKQEDDADTSHENRFEENWVEITAVDTGLFEKDPEVNEEGNCRSYLFAYRTKLAPNEKTTPLFGKIQNKKYGSRTISANEVENIKIESFAIQAEYLMQDGIDIDTSGVMDEETLTAIWQMYFNQEGWGDEPVSVDTEEVQEGGASA